MAKEYIRAFKTEDGRPVGETAYEVEGLVANDVLDGRSMVDEYIVLKSTAAIISINITGDDIRVIKETASSKTIQNYGKKEQADIQISGLTADTKVTISGNITLFDCYDNHLTTLDVTHCTQLEQILCSTNELMSIDLTHCTQLKQLNCDSNQITSLDVSKCTKLETLYCEFNQLTELDVSRCTQINELLCYSNAGILVKLPQSDVVKQVVYGYDDSDNPPTQEQIAAQVAALPYSVETSYLYIPYGEIYGEIPEDVIAAAAAKGWEISSEDY